MLKNHAYPLKVNRLDRQFEAPVPDRKWCVDLTYVPTGEGFLYVAAVLDLCSRKIVGWQMAGHLRAELCTGALDMALSQRRPSPGLLHHSDRGIQYCCGDYQKMLAANDHRSQHEPPGRLLRQRGDGELLGHAEAGTGLPGELPDERGCEAIDL